MRRIVCRLLFQFWMFVQVHSLLRPIPLPYVRHQFCFLFPYFCCEKLFRLGDGLEHTKMVNALFWIKDKVYSSSFSLPRAGRKGIYTLSLWFLNVKYILTNTRIFKPYRLLYIRIFSFMPLKTANISKVKSLYHIELNHPDSKWHIVGHQGSSPAPARQKTFEKSEVFFVLTEI